MGNTCSCSDEAGLADDKQKETIVRSDSHLMQL